MPTIQNIVMFIIAIFIFPLNAQCISGNCYNGNGIYLYEDGRKYIGEFKNKKFDGHGKFIFKNGSEYDGEWKNNLPNGQGEYLFSDGSIYIGFMKDGQFHGQGTITYPKNSEGSKRDYKYKGEWKNGLKDGKGTYYSLDGNAYDGEWKYDQRNGLGQYTNWFPYYTYFGEWTNNNYNGIGLMIYLDEKSEIGLWLNGSLLEKESSKDAILFLNKNYQNNIYLEKIELLRTSIIE